MLCVCVYWLVCNYIHIYIFSLCMLLWNCPIHVDGLLHCHRFGIVQLSSHVLAIYGEQSFYIYQQRHLLEMLDFDIKGGGVQLAPSPFIQFLWNSTSTTFVLYIQFFCVRLEKKPYITTDMFCVFVVIEKKKKHPFLRSSYTSTFKILHLCRKSNFSMLGVWFI